MAIDLDRVGAFRRLRSGLALLLLLAFVGTLLAAAIGTLLFMAGLALRNAVS
jgi:integral membrane sensor domain MASE1